MNSFFHAKSSAAKWGGKPEDYQPIHDFIDSSKRIIGDVRHRAIYHHTEGTFLCERIFGVTIINSAGKQVPVRLVAERHILEDLGWLPTPADYLKDTPIAAWMSGAQRKELPLSRLLKDPVPDETYPPKPEDEREHGPEPELPTVRVRDIPGFGDFVMDRAVRPTFDPPDVPGSRPRPPSQEDL